MAKEQKVYMPLVIGDWLKGTRGMKAEVRGVYINLLLFQWDNGYIPSDLETLALIDPEVGKVWVILKDKFVELEPGKLHNVKNDEIKAFWSKQRKNGVTGGRPRKEIPNNNPKCNPDNNPNNNLHNDLALDHDNDLHLKGKEVQEENQSDQLSDQLRQECDRALDERTIENIKLSHAYPGVDIDRELQRFKLKVAASPRVYADHGTEGLRLAFNAQLRSAKTDVATTPKKRFKSFELEIP